MSKIYYPHYTHGSLDPQSELVLKQIAESNGKPLSSLTPEEARASFLEKKWLGAPDPDVRIFGIEIDGNAGNLPMRIYTPKGEGPFPLLLYFHGGGFVLGSLGEFDSFCTYLSNGAACIVVSVDYRLAPENKYPAAVEDAKSSFEWLMENGSKINGDTSRIIVGGDSAGANLAAVISQTARGQISAQLLVCPWLDLSSTERKSYEYFGKGLWLSTENINWYRNHYLTNLELAKNPLVSPLLSDELKNLPPAIIIAAEFDVLKDEAEEYAQKLEAEHVPVEYKCMKGVLHDFITLPGLFDKANEAIGEICSAMKKAYL